MREVKKIRCDSCGYEDDADKFPDDSLLGLPDIGYDSDSPGNRGYFRTVYFVAGAICPECGNFSSLDFNPEAS